MVIAKAFMLGFLLGIRHAADPDHAIAVSTIITETRSLARSLKAGLAWGVGHAFTLSLAGGLILLLGLTPPPAVARWLEGGVGVMLLLLGIATFRRYLRERVHIHSHRHGEGPLHTHFHAHQHHGAEHASAHHSVAGLLSQPSARAFVVGCVHGLAGSTGVSLLALTTLGNQVAGAAFIVTLALGTLIGMGVVTAALAVPALWLGRSSARARGWITATAGAGGVSLGIWMIAVAALELIPYR